MGIGSRERVEALLAVPHREGPKRPAQRLGVEGAATSPGVLASCRRILTVSRTKPGTDQMT